MLRKVVFLCQFGVSIQSLANKVEDRARSLGYNLEVYNSGLKNITPNDDVDLFLLAPQIRFQEASIKSQYPNIAVQLIDMQAYGMRDEDAILQLIKDQFND